MKITLRHQALRDYAGRLPVAADNAVCCRSHFRVSPAERDFIRETSVAVGLSENAFCAFMLTYILKLLETELFADEIDRQQHSYARGGYSENVFVRLDEQTFLTMQYLKEQLHFYSYCELFRFVVGFFMQNLALSDADAAQAGKRLQDCAEMIVRECWRRYGRDCDGGTIVPSVLRRVRATAECLSPAALCFLQKLTC